MCRSAKPKVGAIGTEEADDTEQQLSPQPEQQAKPARNAVIGPSGFGSAPSAPDEPTDMQFLGKFDSDSDSDGSFNGDFMAMSVQQETTKVVKLNKRVSNLLYENANGNKCIDCIVRAANCVIKRTVDTGGPSSYINKRTADRLLGNKATKATYCPASRMKNYAKHIDYNNKQKNILS